MTTNERRASMMWGLPWANIPISSDGTVSQGDKQMQLNEHPGVDWTAAVAVSKRREIAWVVPIMFGGYG